MEDREKYLNLLASQYPSVQAAAAEIINLEAILRLPKGTEHFLSDLHGEYEAFCHIMNNCSGVIREKVDLLFERVLPLKEREALATLIYYPKQIIAETRARGADMNEWYRLNLYRLVEICRTVGSKYTRSKVRKTLPKFFDYIIDELVGVDRTDFNKEEYYKEIFYAIIELGRAEAFIVALTDLIKDLAVDHLHIVGDIFDRGERPDLILDLLEKHHSVDVQWGNHDIMWMGAAMGSPACIATAVDLSLKYGNCDLLENGYGISLRTLSSYAEKYFGCDERFLPLSEEHTLDSRDAMQIAKMRKAIFFLMLKLEGALIARHPEYGMADRDLLAHIDFAAQTVELDGEKLRFDASDLTTVDPSAPHRLTEEEAAVVNSLRRSFLSSEKLKRHLDFLMSHGSLYLIYNDNLIYHGCIPLRADGSYAEHTEGGRTYAGKAYMDLCERRVRAAYAVYQAGGDETAADFLWYLWCGKLSPLFGRDRMTTFERLYLQDERFHAEHKNPYYTYYLRRENCEKWLRDFGISGEYCHIVNGHVPVKQIEGESPIKADGKLIVIDGGFCRAYHQKTGIAGYTLIYNSYGLRLSAHEPFDSIEKAIEERSDIHSNVTVFETSESRIKVGETDIGRRLKERIADLKELLHSYRCEGAGEE